MTHLIFIFFLFIWNSIVFAQGSETEILRQMQQMQSQAPGDTRIAEYFERLKAAPTDPEAHFALAELYRERGLFELAISSYRRSLAFNPNLSKSHVGLSKVFRKKGMKALELFEMQTAVRISPQDPQLLLALGNLYMEPETFDYNQAKKQYKELVKIQSPLAAELGAKMGLE
jgi:tetratricopeptide (TPR) repeat protein